MRVKSKSAQSAAKSHQLEVKLFRMTPFGIAKMSQHRKTGINGVHKPKSGNFLRGEPRHAAGPTPGSRQRGALFVKDANQAPGDHHQPFTRADQQTRGDESRVVEEMSRAIAHD